MSNFFLLLSYKCITRYGNNDYQKTCIIPSVQIEH